MIKLREFSLSDLEEVMEIERVSFPKSQAYSENYFQKYFREYPQGFIIIKNEEKILGYAIGQAQKEFGEIISIASHPARRKKGVGKTLANFLIAHFKKKSLKKIFLHVRKNNLAAISFYKNLGFQILKTVKNYYQNSDDAYLMERKI